MNDERPFDYARSPAFVPTRPDLARGTLTRRMHIRTGSFLNAARARDDRAAIRRLCRINNYLLRRERRLYA